MKKLFYTIGYLIGYFLPYVIITSVIVMFIKIGVWIFYF